MNHKDICDCLGAKQGTRLFGFVGLAGTGKDWLAKRLGFNWTLKFAGPLYELASVLYPGRGFTDHEKRYPGSRELLQKLGAWGRGETSGKYPLSVERALFLHALPGIVARTGLNDDLNWDRFGNPEFWIETCIRRASRMPENDELVAVTDCRYPNEMEAITERGGHVVLIACHPETLDKRRKDLGYPLEITDSSEDTALQLTDDFLGGRLDREPWNDRKCPYSVFWNDDPTLLDAKILNTLTTTSLHGSTPSGRKCLYPDPGDTPDDQGS